MRRTLELLNIFVRFDNTNFLNRLMKIYFISALFLLLDLNTYAQDSLHSEKIFGIKSCKIVYVFDIGIAKGEKTIVFDDWGNTAKEYGVVYPDTSQFKTLIGKDFPHAFDTIPLSKIPQVQHLLKIQTKGSMYIINLDTKTGYASPYFQPDSSFKFPEGVEKIIGNDTFLNRNCIVKSFGDKVKFWYWNNLVLKKEFEEDSTDGTFEYATFIDENYIIKSDEFEIPKDITIK